MFFPLGRHSEERSDEGSVGFFATPISGFTVVKLVNSLLIRYFLSSQHYGVCKSLIARDDDVAA